MSEHPFATWLPVGADPREPVDVFALLPAGAAELRALCDALWEADVDPATLERCRQRITALVTGRADTLEPPAGSDAQRAALDFAEQFVLDPHGCTDEQMLDLSHHFSAPQLATLTTAIAVFDALARVHAVLALAQEDT
jgi:alkylhydroperoxidase family enzyme